MVHLMLDYADSITYIEGMEQASQTWYDGHTYYRWHIVTRATQYVTWARTKQDAEAKARKRGLKRFNIEPAPHAI
ncbi:hypothetical protein LCGC14_1613990 [marine sediment metagenome]|uniref:Uncharacterized protein n=1 Tax=marine sediment metagenome TaxID=412755 RepID=A0A0F9I7Q8_9ZZZZ